MESPAPTPSNNRVMATEFHCFPKLPIELRLKIWGLTIEPRMIKAIFSPHSRIDTHKYISHTPILLHINRESRTEGLRFYELSKQNEKTQGYEKRNAMNRFYFYPEIDTLCITQIYSEAFRLFLIKNECQLLRKVKRLAIAEQILAPLGSMEFSYIPTLVDIRIPVPLGCPRWGNCTRTKLAFHQFQEIDDAKAEAREKGTPWEELDVDYVKSLAKSKEADLKILWGKDGKAPYPKVRFVSVCCNYGRCIPMEEFDRFRAAEAARASGSSQSSIRDYLVGFYRFCAAILRWLGSS